jgi:hypothetical protein
MAMQMEKRISFLDNKMSRRWIQIKSFDITFGELRSYIKCKTFDAQPNQKHPYSEE